MDYEEIFNSQASVEEQRWENSLRPANLAEIIGMQRTKDNLEVMIGAAKQRSGALDHILFHGPPGLGKTSLAMAIAAEMGVNLVVTSGPALTKPGELAAMLTAMPTNGILFIDEIHRLRQPLEEILYSAMEDRTIDVVIGKGPGARSVRIDLPEFTLLGATTKLSMLSSPLRSRFGADFRVDFYSSSELQEIVLQKAAKLGHEINSDAALLIAERARMTARIAVRIFKRARDLATVRMQNPMSAETVEEILRMLDIDNLGLDTTDRALLSSLYYKFNNKPIGVKTLAASLAEEPATIEDVCEPFLLRLGLIERTPRGRVLTANAIEYILQNPSLFN